MPNRIIKESVNESRGLSACTIFAQDLYKRLITYADDYGRFNADTEIMLARLYPRDYGTITQQDVVDALVELAGVNKIAFYTSSGRKEVYGCFPNWGEHQRVRDSKTRCPDPDDTTVNDWYLRRFVSIDMRAEIIERDGFKCQSCGKFLTTMRDARRFAKLGSGMYHIDHTVPCAQGGRATLENLRLLCPACNLSRKRRFTFDEILNFGKSPQVAEICGEIPPNPIRIQSESNPNPNPNPNAQARVEEAFEKFWDAYPRHENRKKAFEAFKKVKEPVEVLVEAIEAQKQSDQWLKDNGQFIPHPTTWLNGERWKDNLRSSRKQDGARELDADEQAAIRRMLEAGDMF